MRSKLGSASKDGKVCGFRGSDGGDESGGKGGALMRGRVAAITGLTEAARVRFKVWGFKCGDWSNLGFRLRFGVSHLGFKS